MTRALLLLAGLFAAVLVAVDLWMLRVSWQISTPRSNSRSSTLRSESGYRTYIVTTSRITSGEESNQRNGLGGLVMARVSPPAG